MVDKSEIKEAGGNFLVVALGVAVGFALLVPLIGWIKSKVQGATE